MKSKKISRYDDKRDYISLIQKNLESMKIAAQQYLNKGNVNLPPIITTRHYLFHDYLKQENKSNDIKRNVTFDSIKQSQNLMNSVPSICNIQFDSAHQYNKKTTNKYLEKIINNNCSSLDSKIVHQIRKTKTYFEKEGLNSQIMNLQYSSIGMDTKYQPQKRKIPRRHSPLKLKTPLSLSLTGFETIQSELSQEQVRQQSLVRQRQTQREAQRDKQERQQQAETQRQWKRKIKQKQQKQESGKEQHICQIEKQSIYKSLQMRKNISKRLIVNRIMRPKIGKADKYQMKQKYQKNQLIQGFCPWQSQQDIEELDF